MLNGAASAKPRVLVLLATYNGEAWIEEQLRSVLAQRNVDVSILVSDDCSSDGTREMVASLAGEDERLALITASVGSGSAAANFIALICNASVDGMTHVALCDQDDIWFESKLEASCQRIAESGAGLYSAATLARWPDGRRKVLTQSNVTTSADFLFEGAGQGCTFVLEASLFIKVQRFVRGNSTLLPRLHYHDWLLYALTRTWNAGWIYDPQPRVFYRQHAANDTGARSGVSAIAKRIALIRSGWYRDQVNLIARLCHAADPTCPLVTRYLRLTSKAIGHSIVPRVRLAVFALLLGRRRWSDRLVLVWAILLGYFNS